MTEHHIYLALATIPWLGYTLCKVLDIMIAKDNIRKRQSSNVMSDENWRIHCERIQAHVDQAQSELLSDLKTKYGYIPQK